MKLNAVRDFQTGIYDYNVMTSSFLRVAAGLAGREGQLLEPGVVRPRLAPGRPARRDSSAASSTATSTARRTGRTTSRCPKDGVLEDALPVLLRGWKGDYLKPGESRTVPFLPSLLWARLDHRPLAWTTATIARAAADSRRSPVPAGRFEVTRVHRRDRGRADARLRDRGRGRPTGSSARPAPTGKSWRSRARRVWPTGSSTPPAARST